MHGRDRLQVNRDDTYTIYFQDNLIISVVPDEAYPKKMYRLRYKNGTESEDFYNLTRAKEHAIKEALKIINDTTEDVELNT